MKLAANIFEYLAMPEITWNTDNLSLEYIARFYDAFPGTVGKVEIARLLASGPAHLDSLARGAWDANDREAHARYKSLAKHARNAR